MEGPFHEIPDGRGVPERMEEYVRLVLEAPADGPFTEIVRLSRGIAPDGTALLASLRRLEERRDCADFALTGLLALMHRFGSSPLLDRELARRIKETLLGFKYWPDEPGADGMCTWSENHQIQFAAGGYLAGQLYPEEVFTSSGRTGRAMMAVSKPRVVRWLALRFRSGFSEWLAHGYYDEDLPPLLNLVQYGGDGDIAERAAMVVDLVLLDIVLNQHRGTMGCTHGRSYERQKKSGLHESTGPALALLFGLNRLQSGNMSAVSFLLADRYRVPEVLLRILEDSRGRETVNLQRVGIRLAERRRWGLGGRDLETAMALLGLEAYADPRTIRGTLRLFDAYRWWENPFFRPFAKKRRLIDAARRVGLIGLVARIWKKDLTRNTREEANLCTYRTPEAMLSSAQDYRKGYGGDQQHVWQATLGPEAVVFTTHPATREDDGSGSSPNYWTGSGTLPRAGQYRNVVLALYRVSTRPGLYLTNRLAFTHAWFPCGRFDEVREAGGWVFGRRGDGYVALWCGNPRRWAAEYGGRSEIVADGKECAWVCEVGGASTHGSFERFASGIAAAEIGRRGLHVRYRSPSCGLLTFGWRGPLRVDGRRAVLRGYPRYGNPYATAAFPAETVELRCGGAWLTLDWSRRARGASGWL